MANKQDDHLIVVSDGTYNRLDNMKVHPRQSFNEVIEELLETR